MSRPPFDMVFCGVGGQGILSLASVLSIAAAKENFRVKQSEIHGMSQRGGAVVAGLRISDLPIQSSVISKGTASLLISMEPLESLRYLSLLTEQATLISAKNPFLNIPNYPDLAELHSAYQSIPRAHLIDADQLARSSGSGRAANMVLVGAASHFLPISEKALEEAIAMLFSKKSPSIIATNLSAFHAGREATQATS